MPPAPPTRATLGDLVREDKLLWVYCRGCGHERDTNLATVPLPAEMPVRPAASWQCASEGCAKTHPTSGDGRRSRKAWQHMDPKPLFPHLLPRVGVPTMTSIGLLLMLDYQVDELRGRIEIEKERIAQLGIEGRNSSKASAALDALERNLDALLAQRAKTVRELEGGQQHRRAS